MSKLEEFLSSGEYLPEPLRDFRDLKEDVQQVTKAREAGLLGLISGAMKK